MTKLYTSIQTMTTSKRIRKTVALLQDAASAQALISKNVEISEEGCHVWQKGKNYDGYGQVSIEGISWAVHRLAYELEYGPIPQYQENWWVLHKCDNPSCCNPKHLYAGTPSDNANDAALRKRKKVGYRTAYARWKPEQNPDRKVGTVFYEFNGSIIALKKLAEELGLNISTLEQRLQAGWPEKDIGRPPGSGRRHERFECQSTYRRFSGIEEVEKYLKAKGGGEEIAKAA